MIKSFADKETEKLYRSGKSRKIPSTLQKTALRKLDYLDAATTVEDLRVPPGNHLEALERELKGKYSIRINRQFRIVFSFQDGDAYDVTITDYH